MGTHDHVSSFLDGHKGYVFDEKTGKLRELRIGTAIETAVEMVPSAALKAEQKIPDQTRVPLFEGFTDDMLRNLGVPDDDFPAIRRLDDPNDFECMTLLQALAETAPKAADALLAYATGNSETRQTVIDLASGSAKLADQFPEAAMLDGSNRSEEFLTFEDSSALRGVLDRGTLQQWQLFLHPDQRSLVERTFSRPARLRGISGSGKPSSHCIAQSVSRK